MESDEDDELLNEGGGMSKLDFSDNQDDSTGSRDDQGGDTSAVMTRVRARISGETSNEIKK